MSEEKDDKEKKERAPWPRFLKGLAAAAFVAAAAAAGLGLAYVDFTATDPVVCRSCHDDEAALWDASAVHPPGLGSCHECHDGGAETSRTGRFSADPDAVTANCLACHEDQKQAEETVSHVVKLSHKVHVTDEGLRCTDCHKNLAHDRYLRATYRPTKWSCYVCHEHKKEIDGPVTQKNCMRCHWHMPDRPDEEAEGGGEDGKEE